MRKIENSKNRKFVKKYRNTAERTTKQKYLNDILNNTLIDSY